MSDHSPSPDSSPDAAPVAGSPAPVPLSLRVAAGVAGLQGVTLLALAVLQLVSLDDRRVGLAVSTAVFFTVVGLTVLGCAAALLRARTWARGPVLVAQLLTVLVAWSSRSNGAVAGTLLVVGLLGIAAMLHPASIRALEDPPSDAA